MNLVAGDPDLPPFLECTPFVPQNDEWRAVVGVAKLAVFLRQRANILIAGDFPGDGLSGIHAGGG